MRVYLAGKSRMPVLAAILFLALTLHLAARRHLRINLERRQGVDYMMLGGASSCFAAHWYATDWSSVGIFLFGLLIAAGAWLLASAEDE
ncbi:hypothetical protein dsx2_1042 [Desulfovibrio sp. X2]|uniref:hypothetical protein n=1 Tax=Desulfovibrio sp. X2 TaxID=941449 RepID=UPI00035872A5|nr:hypothetical protein [Desulfovibrio sp. X2]EPR37099.1 hypothetical protein dsx2_1042 [Desulfovibrio sp. X2]